jgi:hypothetical protein
VNTTSAGSSPIFRLALALSFSGACAETGEETGESSDSTSGASSDEDGEGTGGGGMIYASDIALDTLYVNQGAAVPVWRDGGPVAVDDRNAPLLDDRMTLVRATYTIDDSWSARQIMARLHVVDSGGVDTTGDEIRMIDQAADLGHEDRNFAWILPPELMTPGVEFYVELFEVDDPWALDPAGDEGRYPAEGTAELGIQAVDTNLEMVLVPIRHVDGTCDRTAVIDPSVPEDFEARIRGTYPAKTASVSVHSTTVELQGAITGGGFGPVFPLLQDLRVADGASDAVTYVGVIEPCDDPQGPAFTTCDTPMRGERLFAVRQVGTAFSPASWNLVPFCLGRGLGLPNKACGGSSDEDPDYPYPEAGIGTWGFDASTLTIKDPQMHSSFQSWCSPAWYSDVEWADLVGFLGG